MSTKWVKQIKATLPGWNVDDSDRRHLKLTHPEAKKPVFTSRTPSDHRTIKNLQCHCRHAIWGVA